MHSTTASEAPCRHCRRPLWHAWDEGLLVRADCLALDAPVAVALRESGRTIYALTHGGHLVQETRERYGTLRLVRTRHAVHLCARAPADRTRSTEQLGLFDLETTRPPTRGNGGTW